MPRVEKMSKYKGFLAYFSNNGLCHNGLCKMEQFTDALALNLYQVISESLTRLSGRVLINLCLYDGLP